MTEPTPRPDDEIVSAVLDGEATADERALVEADPAARARLEQLRAARDLVAAPVAVPAAARERALAAALGAFDGTTAASKGPNWVAGGSTAVPPADPIEPAAGDELAARRARAGRSARGGRWLAAAAAVVVVVIGAGVAVRLASSESELQVAANAPASQDQNRTEQLESEASDSNGGTDAGAISTTTMSAPAVVVPSTIAPATTSDGGTNAAADFAMTADLGSVATTGELRDRMLAVIDGRSPTGQAGPPTTTARTLDETRLAYSTCAASITGADPEITDVLAAAIATIDGRPTVVFAYAVDQAAFPAANGSVRIYAIDSTTCATYAVLTVR